MPRSFGYIAWLSKAQCPQNLGYAPRHQLFHRDTIAAQLIGDDSTRQGAFHSKNLSKETLRRARTSFPQHLNSSGCTGNKATHYANNFNRVTMAAIVTGKIHGIIRSHLAQLDNAVSSQDESAAWKGRHCLSDISIFVGITRVADAALAHASRQYPALL
jgi:hypothetical protein